VGPPHFEEEAEHPVVADLQRADARPLHLAGLVAGDPGLAATGKLTKFVEPLVESLPDEAALSGSDRAALGEGGGKTGGEIVAGIEAVAEFAEQACCRVEQAEQARQHRHGMADPFEVAGPGPPGDHSAHEPLEITHAGETVGQPRCQRRVVHEPRHRIEPLVDRQLLHQRGSDPCGQQATAHGGSGAVEHAGERPLPRAAGEAAEQFEAPPGSLIDLHPQARPPGGKGVDPGHRRRFVLLEVGHDSAGRGDARRVVRQIETEALEPTVAQSPGQRRFGRGRLEPPVGTGGEHPRPSGLTQHRLHRLAVSLAAEAFGRVESKQQVGKVVAVDNRRLETSSGHVDPGHARAARSVFAAALAGLDADRHEPVAAGRLEKRLVGRDSRCHDPGHLAAEQALGGSAVGRWRLHLLADRHPASGSHELCQLRVELVVGKARHRHRVGPLVAAGERQPKQVGHLAGVVAEEFIEVSHPEQQHRTRTAGLGLFELLHHWRRHDPRNVAQHEGCFDQEAPPAYNTVGRSLGPRRGHGRR